MNKIYQYLIYILKNTFETFPEFDFFEYKSFLLKAFDATIIDCNIKYKGKLVISTESDLLEIIKIDSTIEAIYLYRLEREIFLLNPNNNLLSYLSSLMKRRTNCEIYYSTKIGEGLNIQHGFGIVIGPRFEIGNNFTIHQGVTLGQKNLNSPNEKIIIGDNVTLFTNAAVLGNLIIANNTKVGANSVLLHSTEENSIYVGTPAKKISK